MALQDFLPALPPSAGPLVLFGLILLAGLIGGEVARRALALPKITGYVLIGLVLGPAGIDWLDHSLVEATDAILDFAVGLVLFELGQRLDLRWLRRDRWLAVTGIAEAGLSFACMYFVLIWFGTEPLFAAFAAAIGMATSPAVVLLVAKEMKAEGQVTERALCLTAMNGLVAFITVTLLTSLVHIEYKAGFVVALFHPAYLLFGSALLGYIAARLAIAGAWLLGKREERQFALLVALLVLTVGAAEALKLSVLVALLTFGILARNLDPRHRLMSVSTGNAGQIFYVVLFVVMGAGLQPGELATGGLMAIVFVLSRFAGKSLGVMLFAPLSRLRRGSAGMLSLALVPMSGMALVLAQGPGNLYPEFSAKLSAVVLSAAMILELIGPLAVQFALRHAGETAVMPDARYGSAAV
ncbi:MAG: cation:proton antiporter [Burkholderiales bacterium]